MKEICPESFFPRNYLKYKSHPLPTVTSQPIRHSTNLMTFIPILTCTELLVVYIDHLRPVWQGTFALPNTWFRPPPPILGFACAPIVETRFHELAMSLLDFSPRIPLCTFSILLCTNVSFSHMFSGFVVVRKCYVYFLYQVTHILKFKVRYVSKRSGYDVSANNTGIIQFNLPFSSMHFINASSCSYKHHLLFINSLKISSKIILYLFMQFLMFSGIPLPGSKSRSAKQHWIPNLLSKSSITFLRCQFYLSCVQ